MNGVQIRDFPYILNFLAIFICQFLCGDFYMLIPMWRLLYVNSHVVFVYVWIFMNCVQIWQYSYNIGFLAVSTWDYLHTESILVIIPDYSYDISFLTIFTWKIGLFVQYKLSGNIDIMINVTHLQWVKMLLDPVSKQDYWNNISILAVFISKNFHEWCRKGRLFIQFKHFDHICVMISGTALKKK